MSPSKSISIQQLLEGSPKKAGDIEFCLAGRQTYLAPYRCPQRQILAVPISVITTIFIWTLEGESRMSFRTKLIWVGHLAVHAWSQLYVHY
jgi:hypothetical protein